MSTIPLDRHPMAPACLGRDWSLRSAAIAFGLVLLLSACGGSDDGKSSTSDAGTSGAAGAAGSGGATGGTGGGTGGGPSSVCANKNDQSWNGSWSPTDTDFPIPGLFDDEYFDGHANAQGDPTPILPPGEWDWDDGNDDLANWRNFETNVGSFELLRDSLDRAFGWRFVPNDPAGADFSGAAAYFQGSSGTDRLLLGPAGSIHSYGDGTLGDGPDVLTFCESYSLHFRTGGSSTGASRDDDLVVAGCEPNPDGSFDITTTTIHTGPGRDWVFVRDLDRAAIDLGNGADGRTDSLDPDDGDDLVVLRGNTHDFRVFGGNGNDTFVWYVDDNVQETAWLGPNFFGGGGFDAALWDDEGIDRLVLAIADDAPIVTSTPTPPGSVLVRATDGEFVDDPPTADDPFAHYCGECGTGPGGRKTITVEYVSPDESVATGYFGLTAIEELQIGIGAAAVVYRIDETTGAVTPDATAIPFTPPEWPNGDCP